MLRKILIFIILLITPIVSIAQHSPGTSDTIPSLIAGQNIRVKTQSDIWLKGQHHAMNDKTLHLQTETGLMTIPTASILEIQTMTRQTKKGSLIGGASGAGIGGLLGAGIAALGFELCDTGACPDDKSSYVLSGTAIGLLLGTISGGTLGAIVGSTVPEWKTVYRVKDSDVTSIASYPTQTTVTSPDPHAKNDRSPIENETESTPQQQVAAATKSETAPVGNVTNPAFPTKQIGTFYTALGYAEDAERDFMSGSLGGRVGLLATVLPHVQLGPEVGYYRVGGDTYTYPDASYYKSQPYILQLFMNSRLSTGDFTGNFPYVSLGLGYTNWEYEFFSYHAGLGYEIKIPEANLGLHIEGRWSQRLQKLAGPNPRFASIAVGITRSW